MVLAVEIEPTFSPGNPEILVQGAYRTGSGAPGRPLDISPDGQRFLMIKDAATDDSAPAPQIILVQNWFEELKARVPVN